MEKSKMKLEQALEVIKTSGTYVTICDGAREIKDQQYFIKWHYKELFSREVKSICANDNEVVVILKQEQQGE
jgi:hypothetical protein